MRKTVLFAAAAIGLVAIFSIGPRLVAQTSSTISINGAQQFQVVDGFGVSANVNSWNDGELRPALDLLTDQLGATIWRVVIDNADWEATNDNGDPQVFDWAYYNRMYTTPKFEELWSTIAYLNQKGINTRLMLTIMGPTPTWMGGSAIDTDAEDEWVEMIASLVSYGLTTRGVKFGLLAPMNEPDWDGIEGPRVDQWQYTRVLRKLAQKLDAIGLSSLRLVGPDTAQIGVGVNDYMPEMMTDAVVMSKLDHFGFHNYAGDSGGAASEIRTSAYPDRNFWITEVTNIWDIMAHLNQGPSAILVWDAYDSVYNHAILAGRGTTPPNDVGNGPPLLAYNSSTRTYSPRKGFYESAQLFRFVPPGSRRIGLTGGNSSLTTYAFYDGSSGRLTIVGRNASTSAATVNGTLANLPSIARFEFYQTTPSTNLQRGADVVASNGAFSFQISGNSVFTLTASTAADTQAPAITMTTPQDAATVSGSTVVSASASDNVGVAGVQFLLDGEALEAEDTTAPYTVSWLTTTASDGVHMLSARVRDAAGNTTAATTITVTVNNGDTAPPAVSVTNPADGISVSGVVMVTAAASDNVGVSGVQFLLDGVALGTEDTTAPYSRFWTTTGVPNGTHTLTAEARDAAGNHALAGPVTVTVGNGDTFAPAISLTAPAAGPVSGTVTVTAAASDNVGVVGVQFLLDGAALGTEDTFAPYARSWITTATPNGTHTLSARARDAAGNQATATPVTVTVSNGGDFTAPTVVAITPASGATGVALTSPIIVTFSEAMLASTITAATISMRAGALALSASVTYANGVATVTTSTPLVAGTAYTVTVRGDSAGVTDLAGNALPADFTWSFTTAAGNECPCSIWSPSARPGPMQADSNAVELGVKFRADTDGYVTGLRFYKYAQNSGPHVGNLWTAGGTRLATVSFDDETASGWQQATFATPAAINANTTYVVSYHTTTGYYAATNYDFTIGMDDGPLHVLSSVDAGGNGVYRYGPTSAFPNQSYQASNYWVDVVFIGADDTRPPNVVLTTPAGGTTVTGTVTVEGTASDNVSIASVQFLLDGKAIGPEDTTAPYAIAWNTVDASNGAHTLSALARDAAGNTTRSSNVTVTVANDKSAPDVIVTAPANGATISGTVSIEASASDDVGVVGIQFLLDAVPLGTEDTTTPYTVSWPTPSATDGTHTLSARARDAAGNTATAAISVTVDNRDRTPPTVSVTSPANGASISGVVTVTASASDDVRIAGVQFLLDGAPLGTEDTFAPYARSWTTTGAANGTHMLSARARDAAGNQTLAAPVTVIVTNGGDLIAPSVINTTPPDGASGVPLTSAMTVTFSEAMLASTITPTTIYVRSGATAVGAAVVYANGTATVTPAAPLTAGTTYTVTVRGGSSGVTDLAGTAMATDVSWSFTTAATAGCPCSVWTASATPGPMDADPNPVELGVKFRSDVNGSVIGLRFYKYAQNTGPHVGNLWTTSGQRLATVTFTNETTSGWQQATFATPVAVTANTTYIVSYYTPTGYYAVTANGFNSGLDNGPLQMPSSSAAGGNGVYRYGSSSAFPNLSYEASNYWVDVVFLEAGMVSASHAVEQRMETANLDAVGVNAATSQASAIPGERR